MATDTGRNDSRRDSVVGNISTPAEVAGVVREFMGALKSLSSDRGFQNMAELIDRIPKLEAEIQEKERMVRLANEACEREKTSQGDLLRKNLSLYKEDLAQVQAQKSNLEKMNAELKAKISQNKETIAALEGKQTELKELGCKMEERCKSVIGKLKAKESEVLQYQQQNQDNQASIGKLGAQLKLVQAEVTAKENSVRDHAARQAQLENALKASRMQQEEVASYAVQLKEVDQGILAQDFNGIWVAITALVRRFVEEDLSDNAFKREWDHLNDSAQYIMEKPLPQTNSPIAKELRVVKVLAILADTIHKHILRPTYQPPEEGDTLSEVLYQLAAVEPKRERMLRGMLLAALEGQQEDIEDLVVDYIVQDVMKTQGIEDVIPLQLRLGFEDELRGILADAQDIWSRVQHGTQVFQSTFAYGPGVQVTDFLPKTADPEQGDALQPHAPDTANDDISLFPIIMLLGEESVPLTTGMVVRKSQIAALLQEERRMSRNVEAQPSRSRPKQRTMSRSNSVRNGHVMGAFLSR